jgi:hypothetical protein
MRTIGKLSGFASIGTLGAGSHQRGSVLIYLIVLMVMFTMLGVGMMSMFSSSVLSIFAPSSSRRAQYLAESGLRYTISEVRNALSMAAKEAVLTAIDDGSVNGKTFNVVAGMESFNVRVYPYFTKPTAGSGTNIITATVSNSGFPPNFAIPTASDGSNVARLYIGQPYATISSASGATPGSKAVTYTLSANVTFSTGAMTTLAFPTTNTSQANLVKGSTLNLNINAVSGLSQKNGEFMAIAPGSAVDGKVLSYQSAQVAQVGGNTVVQLNNLNWRHPDASFTFPAGTYLSFRAAARLDSTGLHGQTTNVQTDYLTLFSSTSSGGGPPANETPQALPATASGFSGNLDALDVTQAGNPSRVVVSGYIATGGTHAYWAAFQHLGDLYSYTSPDPNDSSCTIGFFAAPIATGISDNLRNVWMQYNQLNYDVQVKHGWDLNLPYTTQGVTVRWHENPNCAANVTCPANNAYCCYQGYGISFMRFNSRSTCSSDLIPNTIKPCSLGAFLCSLFPNWDQNKLLLVLWEQKVNDTTYAVTKDWLAYTILGYPTTQCIPPAVRSPADPDQKVTGNQGWPDGLLNDDASIVVRVEDKFVNSVRYTDIKVFYGDGSPQTFVNDSRVLDSIATNKERGRYYPQWTEVGNPGGTNPVINPQWPTNNFGLNASNKIAYWYSNLTTSDYFTLGSNAPTAPFNTVTLTRNTTPRAGFSAVNLLTDGATIRTTDYVLDSFPGSRKEIGLFAMGDLNGTNHTVAFDDFYIQILGGN